MARKRKKKKFSAVTTVREMARELIGSPPATRRDQETKKSARKAEKHKKTLGQLLEPDEG